MHAYLAHYTLRNGSRGVLHLIASCSCDTVVACIDTFGEALRTCAVRPA